MNKNVQKLLLSASLLAALSLAGCSDKGETVASSEAGKIYEEELYEELKSRHGAETLRAVLISDILEHRYGDKVTDEDVQALVDENIESAGGEDQFERFLAANNLTIDSMKESTRQTLLIAEAVKEYEGVTEEDIKAFYEEWSPEVTTSHILVKEDDEDLAKDIIKQLDDGADFKELVQEHSTDTASAQNDGQVKFVPGTDKVVKEYEEAAMKLGEGEYTKEPVKSAFGYHIIMMNEKPEKGSYEEEKEVVEKLYMEKLMADQNKIRDAIQSVAEVSNIIINDQSLSGALNGLLMGDSKDSDDKPKDKESEESKESEASDESEKSEEKESEESKETEAAGEEESKEANE